MTKIERLEQKVGEISESVVRIETQIGYIQKSLDEFKLPEKKSGILTKGIELVCMYAAVFASVFFTIH